MTRRCRRHLLLVLDISCWGSRMYRRTVSSSQVHFIIIVIIIIIIISLWPVLFFSRPRSEGWPHHGGTLSIYLCPLSFRVNWLSCGESCPCVDVVHPGRAWSSSPACTQFSKRVHETCKHLLNVYVNMAASNKTQMVLSHDNSIIVSSSQRSVSCDVGSAAWAYGEVHSFECHLVRTKSQNLHVLLLTGLVESLFHSTELRHFMLKMWTQDNKTCCLVQYFPEVALRHEGLWMGELPWRRGKLCYLVTARLRQFKCLIFDVHFSESVDLLWSDMNHIVQCVLYM